MNISSLQTQFRGEIVTPASSNYDLARQIWNGMIDRRPSAIVRCAGQADVVSAVRFAAEHNLFPAIRGAGHNVAGLAMLDDGLVIDLSLMKGIFVDPTGRTAIAQTGLTWGEFDRETQLYGLATTGGIISTTGIAGLTLGGGVGWLMGRCGLVCDNTLAYDVVTADGAVIQASATEHPDLFWALKGGGGNFGVVTSITYRLHIVGTVLSGMILHPLARAREVIRFYRDFVASGIPDELTVYVAAVTTPDGIQAVALLPAWSGEDLAAGERILEPLRKFGSPIADLVGPVPYPALQQMLDLAAPHGIRSYWKASFMHDLPDEAIDTFVSFAECCSSPRTIALFEHAHGAVARVAPDATAFPTRSDPFDFVLVSLWDDPSEDARHVDWTRRFYAAMQPWFAGSVYVNGLDQDDTARVPNAFGPNYDRLCAVKSAYDPGNRFRRNHNIAPRAQAARE